MAERIWIVSGEAGEYDDRREWAESAWRTKAEANHRVAFLTAKLEETGANAVAGRSREIRNAAIERMKVYDPLFQLDDIGSSYSTYYTELRP